MSYGKKSEAYYPINDEILKDVVRNFGKIPEFMVTEIYEIMTKNCKIETLLFVSLIGTIDRFLSGKRESNIDFGFLGAGLTLSAIRKGNTGKMQTLAMELVHDVVVELWMAGGNFRELQKYLGTHGLAICSQHSCRIYIVRTEDQDRFYELSAADQLLRTELDWSGETYKESSMDQVIRESEAFEDEIEIIEYYYQLALKLVKKCNNSYTNLNLDQRYHQDLNLN